MHHESFSEKIKFYASSYIPTGIKLNCKELHSVCTGSALHSFHAASATVHTKNERTKNEFILRKNETTE